jgi:MFS transporter, DHA2 family, multidrug resistance protein
MAVFAMGVVVAPILGPTLGGWITDNYTWRWVFYINLPIGLLAGLMANAFIEDPPYLQRVEARSIDYIGFGFLAIWLATLQFVLDKGQELDWFGSHTIVWCVTISAAAFLAFVVRELTARKPLVDLRVLKNRNLAVGCALIAILGALLYGTIAVLPLFMQNLLHYTALDAGLALSPRGIGAFLATIIVGRLVGKISNRILITIGFIGLAYSSWLFGNINLTIGMSSIVWPTILSGVAISFIFVPLATSSMGTLEQNQIGNASGLFNLMRNLGGSIGIAGLTTLVARGAQSNQAAFVGRFSQYNPAYRQKLAAIQHGLAAHEGAWRAAHQAPQILYGILGQQSLLVTYSHNFRLFGLLCLITTPLVLLFKKVSKRQGPGAAH